MTLSIDFGTSNTAAAYRDHEGRIHQLRLSQSGWLMPSAVLYRPGEVLVGTTAQQSRLIAPEAYEDSPKRRLADGTVLIGDAEVPASDLVAAVLADVLQKARTRMGTEPDQVVLTHPDKWGEPMQQLLRQAGRTAGIDAARMQLMSEATAAARYYSDTASSLPVGARLAVFDFGAGTCDVAVLDKQPDHTFAVIRAEGEEGLGGNDLDARIKRWVFNQLERTAPEMRARLDDPANRHLQLTLNDQIRNAKEALSETTAAPIPVADNTVLHLTREEFEQLISSEIDRACDLTRRVLTQANDERPVTDKVTIYLTGGSSAIPLVHSRLSTLGNIGQLGDPKMVVAEGALHAEPAASPPTPLPPPPPPRPPVDPRPGFVAHERTRRDTLPPPAAPPPEKSSNRGLITAGVIGVVIVAGGVGAAVMTSNSGGGSASVPTFSTQSSSSGGDSIATASSSTPRNTGDLFTPSVIAPSSPTETAAQTSWSATMVGTCDEGGADSCGVRQRDAPRNSADTLSGTSVLKDGTTVTVVCRTSGDSKDSSGRSSSTWYGLQNGAYLNAVYTDLSPTSTMPSC